MIEEVDPNEKGGRNPKEVSNSKTPVLDNFSRDLIKHACLLYTSPSPRD